VAPPAAARCLLCAPQPDASNKKPAPRTIELEIETRMDFANIGLVRAGSGGSAQIDAATGLRSLSGALVDLGGMAVSGTVTIRGEPSEHVVVTFPPSILLYNSAGAAYPLGSFATTLKNNPKLGDDGTLSFTFGGVLQIDGSATGVFRGSVPVTAEYRDPPSGVK
jgi:hypothetical protein